jgi:hypothetical protein
LNQTRSKEEQIDGEQNDEKKSSRQVAVVNVAFSTQNRARRRDSARSRIMDDISLEQFVYGGDQSTLGARWSAWLERFKLFLTATNLTDNERIKSTFLLKIGPEVYEIYKTLKKANNTDTMNELYTKLTTHLNPSRSKLTERCIFRSSSRRQDESVDEYAMRLRQLALNCKFGEQLEDNILEQFVVGCDIEAFQRQCCRQDDLTLKQALELARGFQRTEQNVRSNRSNEEKTRVRYKASQDKSKQQASDVTRYSGESKPKDLSNKSTQLCDYCDYCGLKKLAEGAACPADGKECNFCHDKNHCEKVYSSKAKTEYESEMSEVSKIDGSSTDEDQFRKCEEFSEFLRIKKMTQLMRIQSKSKYRQYELVDKKEAVEAPAVPIGNDAEVASQPAALLPQHEKTQVEDAMDRGDQHANEPEVAKISGVSPAQPVGVSGLLERMQLNDVQLSDRKSGRPTGEQQQEKELRHQKLKEERRTQQLEEESKAQNPKMHHKTTRSELKH